MKPSSQNTFKPLATFLVLALTIFSSSAQTFDTGKTINGHNFTGDLKAFDADNDGDLDVLSFPYLYLNDGTGKKQKIIELSDPNKQYESFAIEDIDNDKDKDLVVLYKNGDIDILINEKKGFVKKQQKGKVNYMPSEYAKVYLYDANADGICDIIISGLLGGPAAYIADKNLQFAYSREFSNQFPKLHVVLGLDINKDGIQELLVYNYSDNKDEKKSLKAYSFKDNKYVVTATIELITEGIDKLTLVDIDKDGDKDLVYYYRYPNQAIYWIERNSKGGLGKTNVLATQLDLEEFELADFDSDGNLDIAYISQTNQNRSIHWAKNTGNNKFIKSQQSLLPNSKDAQKFIFEDFNGDKIKDILFYYDDNKKIRHRYNMVLQDKNGQIKEQNTWMTTANCNGFILTDLNNNGTKDIVGYYNNELFYLLNEGNGKYSEAKELAISPFQIRNLQSKDINNDGKEDLILSTNDSNDGKLGYFKNEGNLQFKQFTMLHDEKDRLLNFEFLDYDNDGNNDLIVNYWKPDIRGFYIYKNTGNGNFDKKRITITEVNNSFPRLALWDVNQDGRPDIVDNGSSSWYKYEGNDNFTKQQSPFTERFIKGIYKANLDNNNTPECVMLSSVSLKYLKYNPQNEWQTNSITVDYGIDMLSVADINADSFDDLICLGSKYGLAEGYNPDMGFSYKYAIIGLENNQNGGFNVKPYFPISNTNTIALDDVDNDGNLDIITSSAAWFEGGIRLWRNTTKK